MLQAEKEAMLLRREGYVEAKIKNYVLIRGGRGISDGPETLKGFEREAAKRYPITTTRPLERSDSGGTRWRWEGERLMYLRDYSHEWKRAATGGVWDITPELVALWSDLYGKTEEVYE